jgi:5'-nucleotidase
MNDQSLAARQIKREMSRVKILITNDDGILARGLTALESAAAEFGEFVTVAPNQCFSSCGHGVTTHRPLTVTEVATRRFMIDGSPADCVRVGLLDIAPDADWVIAGVNSGGNLGVDIYMSGTVAAAREAMLLGRRSLAISQYRKSREFDAWDKSSRMAWAVLQNLLPRQLEPGAYWNVNLPDEPGDEIPRIVTCPVDLKPLAVEYRREAGQMNYAGNYQSRPRTPGHDVEVCFGGAISVSLLRHIL